ncbi:hypothetical protein AF335_21955 [Streptomyces eurocidicus]|uniref:Uncharacterized protein n=1 Tax=Streptomyces eurocidicus TaxID=66423 RepID=A0A2N8NS08_STREU|nr:hypothetical protein [Streptomyces eurocidicus]MBB5122799.1 hypothetical protein [Streptomyces eurocidicus]MBF6054332.1 hypothetical protein [Streptomyces eurocidicus]PNE31548.1 hypothetical protein AF335_21955 [Streptomyces eurocidicus]
MAALTAGTAACDGGDASLSPDAKVKQAFDKLSRQKSLSAEIGFDTSADKIFTAMKDQKDFKREHADMLADLRLSYSVSFDKPLKDVEADDENGEGSFALGMKDGKPLVEVRAIGASKVYLRGDLKGIGDLAAKVDKKAPAKSSSRPDFDELAKKADTLPSSMDSVKGALKGEWVGMDTKSFEAFSKASGKSEDKPKLDPKDQKQLFDALQKSLDGNATFKDAGKKNGADHVKVTVPAKKFADDLNKSLKPLQDKLGSKGKGDKVDGDLDKLKNKDVTLDVGVRDGMVSTLTVDIAQLDDEVKGELPLTLGIKGGAGKIQAPAGAKELKPQDLIGAAMLLFSDKMGGGKDSGMGI